MLLNSDTGLAQSFAKDKDISVKIPADDIWLEGNLYVPTGARGIVIFAHGSGSSRHSPRNRYVAETLNDEGIGTLLVDLLTVDEEKVDSVSREHRFNIPMLVKRLTDICDWVRKQSDLENLKIGYLGASTGGGAALIAATNRPSYISAVVSRGGRPDLAGNLLPHVTAPTLLIVGGKDKEVIALNRQALEKLNDQSQLDIIPRASHLFEEPGTLEQVAQLAAKWFNKLFV